MKTQLSVSWCVLLMILPVLVRPQTDNELTPSEQRVKRSLPSIIISLLRRASPMQFKPFKPSNIRYYRRSGGARQAMQDFLELRPTNLKEYQGLKIGKVGEADVELIGGRTLAIKKAAAEVGTKPPGPIVRIITYFNN